MFDIDCFLFMHSYLKNIYVIMCPIQVQIIKFMSCNMSEILYLPNVECPQWYQGGACFEYQDLAITWELLANNVVTGLKHSDVCVNTYNFSGKVQDFIDIYNVAVSNLTSLSMATAEM